jgi:phage gp45-like
MNRNSLMEISGRVTHFAQRFTLNKADSDPMLQTLTIDGMNSEGRKDVEQFQNFGFTATPLPRDEQEKQGQQQQGGGGDVGGKGEQMKGPAAEGVARYIGGQRNHPVIFGIDDRRHRPMGLKPGENAQYDDQGQMTLLRRNGTYVVSLDSEEKGKDGKSKTTERMVSLRHVEKKKQERQQGQQGSRQRWGWCGRRRWRPWARHATEEPAGLQTWGARSTPNPLPRSASTAQATRSSATTIRAGQMVFHRQGDPERSIGRFRTRSESITTEGEDMPRVICMAI